MKKYNSRIYKIYISEAENAKLERMFNEKYTTRANINKNINKKHYINISIDSYRFLTIKIIDNLDHSTLANHTQKLTVFSDINKFIYKLTINDSEEYLIRLFIEQKNDYKKRRHTLCYNYVHDYKEEDYWELLKILDPTNVQELLDFCFILILNAQDIYNIKNYRTILINKFNYYGLNTEQTINPIENKEYKEDIYSVFYKMLLYEIIDEKNELISISPQMRLRRQEKIKDKVFNMYNNFIKNNDGNYVLWI